MWQLMMGSALSAASSLSQGAAASMNYKANAAGKRWNAAILRQEADQIAGVTNQKEEQQRYLSRIAQGDRNAAIGTSGTGWTGSNADFEHQQEVLAELDSLNIRYEGTVESQRRRTQASLQDYFANIDDQNADIAQTQGLLGAGAALFGGYGKYAGGGGGGAGPG